MSLHFICILPDVPGVQSKRMEVRPRHIETAKSNNVKGIIPFAGAMIEDHVAEGQVPNFKGSVLCVAADSREECMSILNSDVYVEKQVWDMEKAQIIPFKVALWPVNK